MPVAMDAAAAVAVAEIDTNCDKKPGSRIGSCLTGVFSRADARKQFAGLVLRPLLDARLIYPLLSGVSYLMF